MTSRANYDGLTRLRSAGTWSPQPSTFPVVLDKEIRGGLRYCSGADGDTLTNIPGAMLQEGMLVWLDATTGSFTGQNYYQYQLVGTESRDTATGTMPNNNANWTQVTLGGGGTGGGATAQSVADVAALNTLADDLDEDDNGLIINLENSTNFNDPDETDPDVTNIPDPLPFTPGADISVLLSWVQTGPDAAQSWRYLRYVRDDPDAAYVLETGDTMTGTLTIDNTTADENALVTGAGHDIVLGHGAHVVLTGTGTADPVNEQTITVSAPDGVAAFDANYEIVLPATEPTDANRFLRASGTGTASPFTLEWAAAGADGASVSVGENPPEDASDDNEGDLWWNTDTGRLFVSFANGDDDPVWTEASPATAGNNQNLQQVLDTGNESTTNLQLSDGAALILENADEDQRITINADDCEADYTVTLPPTAPTADGQVLSVASGTTDAELAWTTPAGGAPVGSVMMFAGATAPDGWLFCDGSAISRTTNAALFTAIGTTYGTGDGSTTFNIPDTRGMFVRGLNTGTTGEDPERTLGSTQAQMTDTDDISGNLQAFQGNQSIDQRTALSGNSSNGASWFNNMVRFSTGGVGTGDETRPVNIAFNYIIRT